MKPIIVKGKKGVLFSLDFSIGFLLMLVIVSVFSVFILSLQAREAQELREWKQKKNRVMLMDSLIKRTGERMPGLALFDESKKRILENRIAVKELENQSLLKEFDLIRLWIECRDFNKQLFESSAQSEECGVMSRLVFFRKKKCLLKGKFCGG